MSDRATILNRTIEESARRKVLRPALGLAIGGWMTFCAACTAPEQGSPSSADPAEEVAAFLDDYLAATAERDTAALRRAYVEDDRFVWIEDGVVRYRSPDEVMASLASLPVDLSLRTELSGLSVAAVGRRGAQAWANFTTTAGTGPEGFSFGGAISFVLERVDGSWRIVGGHTSSSASPRG